MVPHHDTSSSLLSAACGASFLAGQFLADQLVDLLQRIQAMDVDFSGHEFDLESRFKKTHEADHADRVDQAAGDEGSRVLDRGLMNPEQNVFSDELPDCGLDLHGSVKHGRALRRFCLKLCNRSFPGFPWVWHLEIRCGR